MWKTTFNGCFFRDSEETHGKHGHIMPKECNITIQVWDEYIRMTIVPFTDRYNAEPDPRYPPIILEFEKDDSATIGRTLLRLGREIKYETEY